MQDAGDDSGYDGAGAPAKEVLPDPEELANLPDAERARELRLYREPRTDFGNGQRLKRLFEADLAFVGDGTGKGTGTWYVWNGRIWDPTDGELEVQARAHRVSNAVMGEAMIMKARKEAGWKGYRDFAWTLQSRARIRAMIEEAKPYLRRAAEDFDAERRVVVLENGTVRLPPRRGAAGFDPRGPLVGGRASGVGVTGNAAAGVRRPEFEAGWRRSDLMTRQLPVVHDPDAGCPNWLAFLETVQPDEDVRVFLQTFAGYCLSGEISAQMLLLFFGGGANGKSTFLNVLAGILDQYAVQLSFESFQPSRNKDGASHTADLARVVGRRLVTSSEPEPDSRGNPPPLASGTIKRQTGGEKMPVRDVGAKAFEFWPTHKVILSFNDRPRVLALDHGTWRRLAMVPWDQTIPDDQKVPDLDKWFLEHERAGIFNWLLDGWEIYAAEGLVKPPGVVAATEEYREDSDPLAGWIAACLILQAQPGTEGQRHERPFSDPYEDEAGARFDPPYVTAAVLKQCYLGWCEENGEDPLSWRQVKRRLEADRRRFKIKKVSEIRIYGVAIREGMRFEKRRDGDGHLV